MILNGTGYGKREVLCLKLDFVPLWLAKHVDPEDKRQDDGGAICDPMGREQHPTIINESGLYSLVLSSKLPTARKFRR